MKLFIVRSNTEKDITSELNKFGSSEKISKILNTYVLLTDRTIHEIKKLEFVKEVKKEDIGMLCLYTDDYYKM